MQRNKRAKVPSDIVNKRDSNFKDRTQDDIYRNVRKKLDLRKQSNSKGLFGII